MSIVETFLHSFTIYYGLDWVALMAGVYGSYLMTNRNRKGFLISAIGCIAGLSVSLISGQFGFVAYNIILMALMIRGFRLWGPLYRSGIEPAE